MAKFRRVGGTTVQMNSYVCKVHIWAVFHFSSGFRVLFRGQVWTRVPETRTTVRDGRFGASALTGKSTIPRAVREIE